MNEFICPYCETIIAEPETFDSDNNYNQHTCDNCGKLFTYEVELLPSYTTKKADCLNETEKHHQWHDRLKNCVFYQRYWSEWKICQQCGLEIKTPHNSFLKCCCYKCNLLSKETPNPDCGGCDENPQYNNYQCDHCPKQTICNVSLNPDLYKK